MRVSFLKEADSLALCNEQLFLEEAFNSFFAGTAGFPKYKSRKKDKWSYTTNFVNRNIRISEKKIRLPKVGEVKARVHRIAPDTHKLKVCHCVHGRGWTFLRIHSV